MACLSIGDKLLTSHQRLDAQNLFAEGCLELIFYFLGGSWGGTDPWRVWCSSVVHSPRAACLSPFLPPSLLACLPAVGIQLGAQDSVVSPPIRARWAPGQPTRSTSVPFPLDGSLFLASMPITPISGVPVSMHLGPELDHAGSAAPSRVSHISAASGEPQILSSPLPAQWPGHRGTQGSR